MYEVRKSKTYNGWSFNNPMNTPNTPERRSEQPVVAPGVFTAAEIELASSLSPDMIALEGLTGATVGPTEFAQCADGLYRRFRIIE